MGPIPAVTLDILRAKLALGWSCARIAKHLGVNISSVYRACYRHGVTPPTGQLGPHKKPEPAQVYRHPMTGVRYGVSAEAARREDILYIPRFFEWRTNA